MKNELDLYLDIHELIVNKMPLSTFYKFSTCVLSQLHSLRIRTTVKGAEITLEGNIAKVHFR